ncbi:hypothetical protein F4804DRAFT_300272 [Jackrogersella minutella]|nr:hypothetical protein F4804DRAFT_300272 [Jackrogersella minutella]
MSSYTQQSSRATSAAEFHHALLRPAILQILRAQGYHSSTPSTIDAITSLATRYMTNLAQQTAQYAALNNEVGSPGIPDLVDLRLAMEDCGALDPAGDFTVQMLAGEEDTKGVENFIQWAKGPKNKRIRQVAGVHKPATGEVSVDGIEEPRETEYLSALKRKHNRTGDDAKYAHTILGRGIVDPEPRENLAVVWANKRHKDAHHRPEPVADTESRPASSGLSSLAEEDIAMMDMEF